MTIAARRATGAIAALLALTLATGACSGESEDPAAPATSASTSAPPEPEIRTTVELGRITGKLPGPARKRLVHDVREVVDGWMAAAYLSGDYPRRAFGDSWPGFTRGARDEAHRERALMSNQDIGAKVEEVRAKRRHLRLDVLAVNQHPVGVTARVLLVFATTGRVERAVRVQGRLYLTRTERGWQVFGYDITKGAAR